MTLQIHSFIAVVAKRGHAGDPPVRAHEPGGRTGPGRWTTTAGARGWLQYRARRTQAPDDGAPPVTLPLLVLGDTAEVLAATPERNVVNAAIVRCDLDAGTVVAHSSIVAIPPLFVYEDDARAVLSSDLHLLAGVPGVSLEFDLEGVSDLARIGHPVAHRTLFRRTRLVPGGVRLTIRADGPIESATAWTFPEAAPVPWPAFVETQIAAFSDVLRRMDVSASFLSLTAGLDTRAVFAELRQQGRSVPAVTMSGVRRSLDARTAAHLCRATGLRHELVTFDDRFDRRLPALVEQAARLSGGLDAVEQGPEIYFYEQLGGEFGARLSGNLGNQVGRGGTEGVSVRHADESIFAPGVLATAAVADEHWMLSRLGTGGAAALVFILQHEVPFTLVANFGVGNHFAVQQSAYASRDLVETLALRPLTGMSDPSASVWRMRLRDLKHRFFGEPASTSFQRTLIARYGGVPARYPINLGWRAAGGVSPVGLAVGAATIAGMVVQKTGLDEGLAGAVLRPTGLPALHNFRQSRRWLREPLREFTFDVLRSAAIQQSGLFAATRLGEVLEAHFSGRADHYETVTLAIDLALAHRHFCQRAA
jgi:hypothetical protein